MAETQRYEEQFAQRFSAEDEEFQRYLQQPEVQPPVVEAWRSRDARFQDSRHHRGNSGQRSHDQRYGGHHNSYNQRRHYNRY
ncbi:RNA guanine-N7 methyltransferase activating subunit-like [Hemibagrus wyckioides]|uniref:RNA guanine-N7 methyltransferase activating subunit-like n=1 Tax=Hemibagrus wyckioides TaxID=337641 RepID=UPI00266CFB1B|nr:RNA guanine-N7 methyltransferase activating subunit-like [Hemibagrus wyckioides]XP_058243448.1 RNA guanine-N7 methyltransferase activating subunit-like [Hemibagrus wyckioides]